MSGLLRLSPGSLRHNRARLEKREEHDMVSRTVDRLPGIPALPRETGAKNKVRVSRSILNLGVRRACTNLDSSKRSKHIRDQHLVTFWQIPDHFPALSIWMSEILDDIGAGKCTVMERRKTYLWRERMVMLGGQLSRKDFECFHFGSQSEGTTTPGLNSDIDMLCSLNNTNIMTDIRDWEDGMHNVLMIHDDINSPQQYLLQVISRDKPEPVTSLCDGMCVMKDSGQVLFSSELWKNKQEQINKDLGEVIKNGPSVSVLPNWDMVNAFHVCQPLPEIQHWIDRCRGRHWPPAQLLEAARVAPSFLVPAGHPDSDYKREEWRLSPNLIERMLMFSFNMTQIKCYIALKLIKTSLFSKRVGDFITSFHCKTAMFYTIDRTHPSLWKENILTFLLLQCLQVLRKWLRLCILPHYIIQGVNLFDGKLSTVQQRRLLQYVDYLIKSYLQDLFYIDVDTLGCRLQACGIRRFGQAGQREIGRLRLHSSISLLLKFEALLIFLNHLKEMTYTGLKSKSTFQQYIKYKLRTCVEYSTNFKFKPVALKFINHLYAFHNSMQLSKCLQLRNPSFSEFITRFKYSLSMDVACSRLKLASILYCCGNFQAAVRVLEDVDRRYHINVKAVCSCRERQRQSDIQVFANMISDNCDNGFIEPPFACCVKFVRQEAYCAPYILLFEMNRGMTEDEVAQRHYVNKQWMDSAEVDARPFLHYLQYLTYGGLCERENQLQAMKLLESFIRDPINQINIYHNETAWSLLGHCYEMEGDNKGALFHYLCSLRCYDTNNAAHWHVQRVLRLVRSAQH